MTRALCMLFVASLACSNQSSPSSAPPPAPTTKAPVDEDKAIIDMVASAMEAGLGAHDLGAYLAIWTDDAQLIRGRSAAEAVTDQRLTHVQNKAGKALRFSAPAPGLNQEIISATVKVVGAERHLSWRLVESTKSTKETVEEIYKLRKTKDGWRVYENRYWLVEVSSDGRVTQFSAEHWAKQDAAVAAARQDDDKEVLIRALIEAGLMSDALAEIQPLADSAPDDVGIWWKRADLAFMAGDGLDATLAACHATKLAPDVDKPHWAKNLACEAKAD